MTTTKYIRIMIAICLLYQYLVLLNKNWVLQPNGLYPKATIMKDVMRVMPIIALVRYCLTRCWAVGASVTSILVVSLI